MPGPHKSQHMHTLFCEEKNIELSFIATQKRRKGKKNTNPNKNPTFPLPPPTPLKGATRGYFYNKGNFEFFEKDLTV